MSRFAPALSVVALVLPLLAGCSGSTADGTGTSEGASTIAPAAPPSLAGNYGARMSREWDGSLVITNASTSSLDFAFEISPDLDVAPIGRVSGTARAVNGHYLYEDGNCTIDFSRVTDELGAKRGDIFVNASLTCAIDFGIDGHTTGATALDFTATWRRD